MSSAPTSRRAGTAGKTGLFALVAATGMIVAWNVWPRPIAPVSVLRLVDLWASRSRADVPVPSEVVHAFTFDEDADAWAISEPGVDVIAEGGSIRYSLSAETYATRLGRQRTGPILARDVDLDAASANAVRIRASISSTLVPVRLLWMVEGDSDFSMRQSVLAPAVPDGRPHEYHLITAEEPTWKGRIVRLGIILSNVPGTVEVESIALEKWSATDRLRAQNGGGSVIKVRRGAQLREAIVVSPGSEAVFQADLPRDASLQVGFGFFGREAPPDARAEIVVEPFDGRAMSFGQDFDAMPRWIERRFDLAPLAGRRARVRLRATGGDGYDWTIAFGSPTLVGSREPGPNVVLVSLDTLRADHVRAYGYDRETTPNVDRLAREGARFADASAAAPHTLASHMTMMTSLRPSIHGVIRTNDRLADGLPTLAERLREAGLRTSAVVDDGYVSAGFGFHRGFERYDEELPDGEFAPDRAAQAFARAIREVERLADQRFFLFVHTYGPHTPYNAPEPWASMFDPSYRGPIAPGFDRDRGRAVASRREGILKADLEHVIALYDGGIRAADDALGAFLQVLDRLDLARETLVVVVSDHGEEFLDHDLSLASHGHSLYQELIHVPLVMRLPGTVPPGRVVTTPVGLVDLKPTVLSLLGLPLVQGVEGRDLVPLLANEPAPPRVLVSQELHVTRQTTLRAGSMKFIRLDGPDDSMRHLLDREYPELREYYADRGRVELYDLATDPRESRDLSRERPEVVEAFRSELEVLRREDEERARSASLPRAAIDASLMERLKALGYGGESR